MTPITIAGKSFETTPDFQRILAVHCGAPCHFPATSQKALSRYNRSHFGEIQVHKCLTACSTGLPSTCVGEVIQKGDQSASELFFRILLFKFFNKDRVLGSPYGSTWERFDSPSIGST